MKTLTRLILILVLFSGYVGFSQTTEHQKLIEKANKDLEKAIKMQDSLMNTPMFIELQKELQRINDQEEFEKKAKKEDEKINEKQKVNPTSSKPTVPYYPYGNLNANVMVIPMGMKTPVKIGTISESGDINFDFPKVLENSSLESSRIQDAISSQCDKDVAIVDKKNDVLSRESGILSLWTDKDRFVGSIYAVSDEDLIPWVGDPFDASPILGSYYKLVYVASDFQYNTHCTQTRVLDTGTAQITYQYDLNLKAGFNFIEYKIEHIYKSNINGVVSFPDKMSVTSVSGIPKCQWIGRYF
jgi:hypothetical protein